MANGISRRGLFEAVGVGTAGLMVPAGGAAQSSARTSLPPLNRFPRMTQEYFVSQVRESERRGSQDQLALRTKADAEAYVRRVREKIRRCFGPMPEKTPLNARTTGVVERDRYKIEKVIFESRPGYLVTANLYLPKNGGAAAPGVVGTCGHTDNGKAGDTYQAFAQGLARLGYVCLLYDPIGQGERIEYGAVDGRPKIRPGTGEHLQAGNQQFLVGEFTGTWRAWDGIRALDFLLTRPEVDKRHIGVTGNSGGGTETTWLCGLEPRWTMAAPGCFVTTFRRNMENELPADTEQCPPSALALGLDHADFIAAMAPKPVILLGKEKDFFDIRGLEEAYGRLKRLYRLLGAEENIAMFAGPGYHGYTQENREAMYRWFNKQTGVSHAEKEPELVMEKDATLNCTASGRVMELKSRTLFSFTKEKSEALARQRKSLSGEALREAVRTTLRLPERNSIPDYRILRPIGNRAFPKNRFATYAVETDPGIQAIVYRLSDDELESRPPRGSKRAILYVSHQSADAELREEPLVRELLAAEPDVPFFACDVRAIGESRPNTCGMDTFLSPYGSDYFYAIHSIMLDRPYAGQRTYDVVRVIEWLQAQGHSEIHLAAKGWGAVPATFAAVRASAVKQVTLKNALTSYSAVAESMSYQWPLAVLVPHVLERLDLPDCYRALEGRNLRMIEPWGPNAGA
jgi:dienelactone hydrolase